MPTNRQVRNSKALTAFQKDLEAYQRGTGKATNEVLATKALDFSIRYSKLLEKQAPSKSEFEGAFKGYNVRVRKSVWQKVGAQYSSDVSTRESKVSYAGRINRSRGGVKFTNKRALAVKQELAKRRASVKWLAKSIPKWKKTLNKDLPESAVNFKDVFARGKSSKVSQTQGKFTKNKDVVIVKSKTLGFEHATKQRVATREKALRDSSKDINKFLGEKIGREFKKNIKKEYK